MASTYLTSGNLSSAGNQKKWTFSAWIKKATTGVDNAFLGYYVGSTNYFIGQWRSDDLLRFGNVDGGSWSVELIPNRVFRDTNAWYHIVFQYDSAQSTSSDRASIWVNGVKETSFAASTYPSQNANTKIPNSGYPITIGRGTKGSSTYYMDGCMSHVHFCDGYAYAASDFGSTDSTTGEWKINTSPSVSYGTNGFFLLKNDNAVTDRSGQGNNFTLGGGTLTKTEDCPSNVFATLNPLNVPASNGPTFSNGNTTSISSSTSGSYKWGGCSTLGMTSGKFYCEAKATVDSSYSRNVIGITGDSANLARTNGSVLNTTHSWGYYSSDGSVAGNGSGNISGFSTSYTTGDIIGIALDLDNNKLYFSKNGTFLNSGVPTSGSTGTGAVSIIAADTTNDGAYFFAQTDDTGTTSPSKFEFNFGNGYFGTTAVSSAGTNASGIGIFEYDVPTGYTALSTKGLNE